MPMIRTTVAAVAAVAAIVALPALPAEIEREEIILSAENCQPALPAFDASIRKRPMAMQNEGSSNAFVTCAFRGVFLSLRSQKYVQVGLVNNGSATQEVACTLVDGEAGFTAPIFLPKTRTLAGGGSSGGLAWTPSDNGGNEFVYPAISCNLPAGVGIQYTARLYDEEIGAP